MAHEYVRHVAEVAPHGGLEVRVLWGIRRIRQLPLVGVGGDDAGVVAGEVAEGDELLVGALGSELDEDGVLYHRVVHDLALAFAKLNDRIAEGRPFLELLVGVVLVAHAALDLAATAQDLLVRRHALLLGEPNVYRPQTPRAAPRGAAQRQPTGVAATRVSRPVDKAEPAEDDASVVGPLKAVLDRGEVHFLLAGLVLDLDVRAVQGDVAPDELYAGDNVIPGELSGLVADLAPQLPEVIRLPGVLLGDDAQYIVGFGVRFAAAGGEGDLPDKLPHLGGDDHRVTNPEV